MPRALRVFLALAILLPGTALSATLAQAHAVRSAYEKEMEAWALRQRLAKTPEELAQAQRPDPQAAARKMWGVINGSLDQPWALDPAAWFLRMAATLAKPGDQGAAVRIFQKEIDQVLAAVAKTHMQAPNLAPMCMALVALGDQPSLKLLRQIEATHPDKKIAGVAALGIAMLGKGMGDDPAVMRERLTMLRKAIIDSADVEIDHTTVAALAEEELYIITKLSKGVIAPDLQGEDSGGRAMKLTDQAGKVVILVFWNSAAEGPEGLLDWVHALRQDNRFAGKPFEVVGVNTDPRETLRKWQADGRVDWPNFSDPEGKLAKEFRVGAFPFAYVLGADRKIQYVGSVGTFAELTAAAVLGEM